MFRGPCVRGLIPCLLDEVVVFQTPDGTAQSNVTFTSVSWATTSSASWPGIANTRLGYRSGPFVRASEQEHHIQPSSSGLPSARRLLRSEAHEGMALRCATEL